MYYIPYINHRGALLKDLICSLSLVSVNDIQMKTEIHLTIFCKALEGQI